MGQVTWEFWKKFPGAGRMASLEDSVGGGDASADHLLEDDVTHEETEDLMGHDESNGGGEDPELEAIKARVQAMEEEAIKLKELQSQMDLTSPTSGSVPGSSPNTSATGLPSLTPEEKVEVDSRSIYVGNVDYGANAEELEQHVQRKSKRFRLRRVHRQRQRRHCNGSRRFAIPGKANQGSAQAYKQTRHFIN